MGVTFHLGDCRDVLPTLEAGSAHCVITSPPYWGLRDYDLPPSVWGGDVECRHEWGERLIQHLRGKIGDNSTLDGGLQASGEGRLKEARQGQFCQLCGAWRGCLGLEPTPEMYAEHLVSVFREVRRVLRDDGTLWLNLGDSYAASPGQRKTTDSAGVKQCSNTASTQTPSRSVENLKPKDLVGIPWRVAFALQADGWWLRSDIIWHKPNCMPESVRDRPTKAHEYIFLLSKSARYWYDADAIKEPYQGLGKPRAFAKRGNLDRNDTGRIYEADDQGGRNKRTVWTIPTKPFKGAHFAVFPPALVKPCIRAGCPTGGTALDPFCGADTVGVVAEELERNAILIDLNNDYLQMAKGRVTEAQKQPPLAGLAS